jgi:hypothetical protein
MRVSAFLALYQVLWTCNAGRAGAHSYRPRPTARGERIPPRHAGSVFLPIVLPEFELRRCSFGFLLTKAHTQPQEPDSQVFTLQSFAQQSEETLDFQR